MLTLPIANRTCIFAQFLWRANSIYDRLMRMSMSREVKLMRCFELVDARFRRNAQARLPLRATAHSVGYDFFSPVDVEIPPMGSVMIWTDVKARFGEDEALLINVRSSMGAQPVMLANTQGWIESDYYSNPDNDGNIGIRLFNLGATPYRIAQGQRFAQGMFVKYLAADNCNADAPRLGGLGSTGK